MITYIYKSATEIITSPTSFYADGTAITSYSIKGNTVQNGTPTPSNPVDVQGVGTLDSGQYKIPISNGQQTTNIYLGSTQTTRQIKKIVLTGDEPIFSVANSTSESGTFVYTYDYSAIGMTDIINYNRPMTSIMYPVFLCSHFIEKTEGYTDYNDIKNGEIGANSVISSAGINNRFLIFATNQYTTMADFQSYLAAQYANGTPVTVWYVLATPTTAAVNEPLMKIGDYADTLSNAAQIPTTEGANSITVDTTVQPSEFSATWTGWHNASVKEWNGSQWVE